MPVATRALRPSTAFPALSPAEKLTRLIALYPKEGAALVGLIDEVWLKLQRIRKRQARAGLKVTRATAARR